MKNKMSNACLIKRLLSVHELTKTDLLLVPVIERHSISECPPISTGSILESEHVIIKTLYHSFSQQLYIFLTKLSF